jgi:hypothetical protein
MLHQQELEGRNQQANSLSAISFYRDFPGFEVIWRESYQRAEYALR